MKTERYKINGMSCAACSASVERVVKKLDGVNDVTVNLIMGIMTVSFDEQKLSSDDFLKVVTKAGFGIEPFAETEGNTEPTKKAVKDEQPKPPFDLIFAAISSALLLYISMGQMIFENLPLPQFLNLNQNPYNFAIIQLVLCLPALYVGRSFFKKGFKTLIKLHPNMDSLVAIGTTAALIFSLVMTFLIGSNPHAVHNLYYESAAVVIVLIKLGKYLEEKSRKKTKGAITALINLSPDYATLLKAGQQVSVPTNQVKVGDILFIKSGEKIALDGKILEGNGSIDESMLTGESMPIEKTVGDSVTGGSLNIDGLLCVEVTKIGADTTLSKIIKFVEEAQSKKAPISKVADTVAGVFVPTVMAVALVSAIVWYIISRDLSFTLKIFTSVLVVACPCALGLATPTAIMVGTGLGAQNGILIRNGETLETLGKTKICVFDKTGTVTTGKPSVTDVLSNDTNRLLKLGFIIESVSSHPIAKAITEYALSEGFSSDITPDNFKNISGKGIEASIDGKKILAGNSLLMNENGISTDALKADAEKFSLEGKSLVYIAEENELLGLIAVADTLKPTSVAAFKKLKKMGIKTAILSGDNKNCAEHIGNELGADLIYSQVLPEEKALIIDKLKQEYPSVMMVGDGINDAPALSSADVGCAIGNGTDVAIEAADLVLMRSDAKDVAAAITLSRLTLKNIKQNLFWAFCYNTICIPVACGILYPLGILMNPMIGGLAMSLSSVCVVSNALRLRFKKIK